MILAPIKIYLGVPPGLLFITDIWSRLGFLEPAEWYRRGQYRAGETQSVHADEDRKPQSEPRLQVRWEAEWGGQGF